MEIVVRRFELVLKSLSAYSAMSGSSPAALVDDYTAAVKVVGALIMKAMRGLDRSTEDWDHWNCPQVGDCWACEANSRAPVKFGNQPKPLILKFRFGLAKARFLRFIYPDWPSEKPRYVIHWWYLAGRPKEA